MIIAAPRKPPVAALRVERAVEDAPEGFRNVLDVDEDRDRAMTM
jgi:hypothetical protein